jgi:hypothetical protein
MGLTTLTSEQPKDHDGSLWPVVRVPAEIEKTKRFSQLSGSTRRPFGVMACSTEINTLQSYPDKALYLGGRVVLIAMLPKGGIWHPVFRYAEPLRAAWLVEHAAQLIHPVGSAESGTISTNS